MIKIEVHKTQGLGVTMTSLRSITQLSFLLQVVCKAFQLVGNDLFSACANFK